jgi:hypothetical protein
MKQVTDSARVLIVDRHAFLLSNLRQGYDVITANRGDDGLRLARQTSASWA